MVMLRCIYETYLWTRWILIDPKNAQQYWDIGKREAARLTGKMVGQYEIKIRDFPKDSHVRQAYSDRQAKSIDLPDPSRLAATVGVQRLHDAVYPLLSWMTHGNILSLGEGMLASTNGQSVPTGASELNVMLFDVMAARVGEACVEILETWSERHEVAPPFIWK